MKRCRVCKENKSLDCFSINKTKKSGINDECKACQKKYFKEYYKKNKDKHIQTVLSYSIERRVFLARKKIQSGCVRCGYNDHPSALQFHHIDPNTKCFTIGSGNGRTFEELTTEIKKCEVLCANCHFIEHLKFDNDLLTEVRNRIDNKRGRVQKSRCDCGNVKDSESILCKYCHDERRRVIVKGNCPPKEVLEKLVWEKPSEQIGKDYGVSGRTIGKWCAKYGIDKPPRGYWTKFKKCQNY